MQCSIKNITGTNFFYNNTNKIGIIIIINPKRFELHRHIILCIKVSWLYGLKVLKWNCVIINNTTCTSEWSSYNFVINTVIKKSI